VIPIVPYYAKQFGASGFASARLLGVYSLNAVLRRRRAGPALRPRGRAPCCSPPWCSHGRLSPSSRSPAPTGAVRLPRDLCSSRGATSPRRQAYIADSTSEADRSRHGPARGGFGLGVVIGSRHRRGAGQYLGSAAPGLVAAGCPSSISSPPGRSFPIAHPDHRTERRGSVRGDRAGLADRRPAAADARVGESFPFASRLHRGAALPRGGGVFGWQRKTLALFFIVFGSPAP